jgi:hypothetical protein
MNMPDLIGPNPCEGCEWDSHLPDYICSQDPNKCMTFQRWDARRELLEALKAGGEVGWWHYNGCAHRWERHNDRKKNDGLSCDCKRGHLIFIPEAQP